MSLGDLNQEDFKSGFIALIGRPNVGKSTFINKFIGEKIAITSPIAQTTRNRLKVILTNKKSQIIFVDTPGIHKPHHLLGERLVQSAKRSIGDVDAVLVIFEASHSPGRGDAFILNLIRNLKIPVIVALNKWDLVQLGQYQERKIEYLDFFEGTNWPVFCCSALTGQGCNELINEIEEKTEKFTNKHPGAVNSPMVGTAYSSPEPGKETFIKLNSSVSIGDTLLIIEAMKVMNSITAHKSGKIVHIGFEDGQPIEFNQLLVVIE